MNALVARAEKGKKITPADIEKLDKEISRFDASENQMTLGAANKLRADLKGLSTEK